METLRGQPEMVNVCSFRENQILSMFAAIKLAQDLLGEEALKIICCGEEATLIIRWREVFPPPPPPPSLSGGPS